MLDLRDNGRLVIFSASLGKLWSRTSGSPLVLGAWPGAAGPRQAAAQYGYPYASPPACTDGGACVADKWYFYQGQCTSWLAYRLSQLNGFAFSNYYGGQGRWGNADNWGPQARSLGIAVNATPALGSIGWYSSGHVAYVEQVNSPTSIVISEMNYDGDNGFRIQSITPNSGYWPTALHPYPRSLTASGSRGRRAGRGRRDAGTPACSAAVPRYSRSSGVASRSSVCGRLPPEVTRTLPSELTST